jgi:dienelactone hydrolase
VGVGVIDEPWPERLAASAVFCLHAPATVPIGIPGEIPVQLHFAADNAFAPESQVDAFRSGARCAGARATVQVYQDAGHFFTDQTLPLKVRHTRPASHRLGPDLARRPRGVQAVTAERATSVIGSEVTITPRHKLSLNSWVNRLRETGMRFFSSTGAPALGLATARNPRDKSETPSHRAALR